MIQDKKHKTVTRAKKPRLSLTCAEDLSLAILQDLEEPIRVLNRDMEIVFANHSARKRRMIPGKSTVGKQCEELTRLRNSRCSACLVKDAFSKGKPQQMELSGMNATGDRWVCELQAKPVFNAEGQVEYIVEIFRDRTHEKRLERQLLQSAKLVSVGEVATGIAHEIRNPLAGIRLGLDALNPDSISDPSTKDILDDISRDITRLDRVVSDLLSFTRARPSQREWFQLSLLFNQVCRYIRSAASQQGVKIHVDVDPFDLKIWADKNQIHQVLLNLLLNSIQAMPDGGQLKITGKRSDSITWTGNRKGRSGIKIVIKDTGCGISEENMQRLFDPFFTTKPNGTGLGLATSLSIVRKHNGEMRINSEEFKGATAIILLPLGPEES